MLYGRNHNIVKMEKKKKSKKSPLIGEDLDAGKD